MLRPALKLSFMILSCLTVSAHASITDQEILLAPPTPSSVSRTEYEETYFPYASRFTLGLGSGVNSFGGNLGKLYSTSSPVLELRGDWAFHPAWSLRAGGELAKYSFNAQPNGAVEVNTQTIRVASQSHFLSTALAAEGFDPYLALSGEWVARSQTFQAFNSIERDNALGLGAGLGTNYLMKGGRIGFWLEAGAGQIFFRDRFDSEYAESGLEDTTGLRYSGRLGMKYLF
jgi:hypothetical protein